MSVAEYVNRRENGLLKKKSSNKNADAKGSTTEKRGGEQPWQTEAKQSETATKSE